MEHPPLVAGQKHTAVHITRLADFSALNAGRPRIEMTPELGGAPVTLPGPDPLRPGAFRVEGTIPPPGRYRWVLLVDARFTRIAARPRDDDAVFIRTPNNPQPNSLAFRLFASAVAWTPVVLNIAVLLVSLYRQALERNFDTRNSTSI